MNYDTSILYKCNNKKKLKKILNISGKFNLRKLEFQIDNYYQFFYRPKQGIGSQYKQTIIRPKEEEIGSIYRIICNPKDIELKKIQKKLTRYLTDIVGDQVEYLHSSKKKVSYLTNARAHVQSKHILSIDIKDFYPAITREKLFVFFKNYFMLDKDIAKILSIFCTVPKDDPKAVDNPAYVLGQGISSSGILAFLVNESLFSYINTLAQQYNLIMTVYVDDITFSSNEKIPQEFINKLFGLIKINDMSINKKKIKLSNQGSATKITGIFIKNEKTYVPNKKKREIKSLYNRIRKEIKNCTSYTEYCSLYNKVISFVGNVHYVKEVEGSYVFKFENMCSILVSEYFPLGIRKRKKGFPFSKSNLSKKSQTKLNAHYQKFIDKRIEILKKIS